MLVEGDSPCDGNFWFGPAAFMGLGAVRLNELTEVMDVSPVRDESVCCALVPHRAKEWQSVVEGHSAGPAPQNGRIRTLAQNQAKMSIAGLRVAIWWC
jgi:hypothetical protein